MYKDTQGKVWIRRSCDLDAPGRNTVLNRSKGKTRKKGRNGAFSLLAFFLVNWLANKFPPCGNTKKTEPSEVLHQHAGLNWKKDRSPSVPRGTMATADRVRSHSAILMSNGKEEEHLERRSVSSTVDIDRPPDNELLRWDASVRPSVRPSITCVTKDCRGCSLSQLSRGVGCGQVTSW